MKLIRQILTSPLQVKLLGLLWLTFLLMAGSITLLSMADVKQEFFSHLHTRTEDITRQFSQRLMGQRHMTDTNIAQLLQEIESTVPDSVVSLAMIDTAGRVIHSPNTESLSVFEDERVLLREETFQTPTLFFRDGLYHVFVPVVDGHQKVVGLMGVGETDIELRETLSRIRVRNFGIGVIITCAASVMIVFLMRSHFRILRDITRCAENIAAGDLSSVAISVQGPGETRRLTRAFQEMEYNFRSLTMQVHQAEELIVSVTREILSATDRLASSLEEQSAAVAQTSINMESVVLASQQISQNTDQVVQIADKTRKDAKQGLEIAEETLKKMEDIQASNKTDTEHIRILKQKSKEISKIIDVIVSIADQTKLIAFNALLEASGAGQAGRRFGVVAKEIRTLAEHVIGSTTMIRKTVVDMQASVQDLIHSSDASTENIQQGAEHTRLTTKWLKDILEGTTKTTRVAQKTSRSLLKQQLASEEISTALKELLANADEFARTSSFTRDVSCKLETLTKDLEILVKEVKL